MYAVYSVKYDIACTCMISCVYCIVTYVRDPDRFRGSHYLSFHGTVLHLRASCCVLTAPRFLFRQPVRSVSGQLVLPWWRDLGSGAVCKLPLQVVVTKVATGVRHRGVERSVYGSFRSENSLGASSSVDNWSRSVTTVAAVQRIASFS